MAMPELLGVSPVAPPSGPRYKARALGVGWVLAGLLLVAASSAEAEKAAGHVTDKGTLTVERCWVRTTRERHSDVDRDVCVGVYRAQNGRTVRDDAELQGSYVPGERVRVYREDFEYYVIGWRAFWSWLACAFGGALLVCLGMATVVVGIHAKTAEELHALRSLLRLQPAVAVCLRWLRRVAVAGLALCFALALISH
ncbi:hypothetical protein [Streptomyces sp. NPDC046261]|uniref:hypothetical protein n=1 Tax=Streptomyces sp. NPDC046261 TaxID=3157200 RepID=UPI0033ED1D97